ncbi:MAG: ankyrin repeat domain-containing protein [Alphaproteobacteria bacterium]
MPKKKTAKKFNVASGGGTMGPLLAPGYTKQAEKLFEACSNGDLKTVKKLVKAGADVNAEYVNGTTALIYAIQGGHKTTHAQSLALVKFLVSKGANVNAPGCSYTALHYAAIWNFCDIVNILLDKGANVNAASPIGDTALLLAVMNNRVEMTRLLIDRGADISAKREGGVSIVRSAADHGQCGEALEVYLNYPAESQARRELLAAQKQAAAEATTVLEGKISVNKPLQLRKPGNLTPSSGGV